MDVRRRLKPVGPYTVALGGLSPTWDARPSGLRVALECDCPIHHGEDGHRLRFDLVESLGPVPDVVASPAQPTRFWDVYGDDFVHVTLYPAIVLACFRGFLYEGNFLITARLR